MGDIMENGNFNLISQPFLAGPNMAWLVGHHFKPVFCRRVVLVQAIRPNTDRGKGDPQISCTTIKLNQHFKVLLPGSHPPQF